jgi:hypothetical protein
VGRSRRRRLFGRFIRGKSRQRRHRRPTTSPARRLQSHDGAANLTDKKIAQPGLSELKEAGVLTDEEFEKEKRKLLAG